MTALSPDHMESDAKTRCETPSNQIFSKATCQGEKTTLINDRAVPLSSKGEQNPESGYRGLRHGFGSVLNIGKQYLRMVIL